MLKIKIKPINKWIGAETKNPKWSPFRAKYSQTRDLLEFELEKAKAIESTQQIEMFINREDLRFDGELRANAKPYKDGVILSFSVKDKRGNAQTRSFPCDSFNDWQANLRGIALSMKKLRDVARYGVFEYENMLGRLSLNPASDESSYETALNFFADHSDFSFENLIGSPDLRRKAYLQASKFFHPDNKQTGNADQFRVVQSMKTIIGV